MDIRKKQEFFGHDSGDIVPFNTPEEDLRDEVNSRTAKAGYTNKQGENTRHSKIIIHPPNDKYRKNYVKIFGHD